MEFRALRLLQFCCTPARPTADYKPSSKSPTRPGYKQPPTEVIDLTKPQLPRVHVKTSGIRMAGRGLFTRDFITKNQWICEYGGELQHASSFPGGFPQGAKGNTHTRGVEPMFSRLQAKNLTPQNADGKLASFANDTKDSKTNNAVFQPKHVTSKRPRKQIWLKATKPINPGDEIFVTYGRDYWRRQQGEEDGGIEV